MEVINCVKDGLNSNSGAIIAIATIALVGVTIYYAWVTRRMLEENRRARLDAQKPQIAIYAGERYERLGRGDEAQSIFLCVENVGTGPAFDVNFDLVDPFFRLPSNDRSGDRLLKDIPLIKHGISCLPSGHHRSYHLSNAHEYAEHKDLVQRQTQIKVTYKGFISETEDSCNVCIDVDFRVPVRR